MRPRTISQRELRFIVTRNGTPVAELKPIRRRQFVPVEELRAAFAGIGRVDHEQFREDIDRILGDDFQPRG